MAPAGELRKRLKRRQDLPPEAFYSPEEAVDLLDRGDRSIIVLSYRWYNFYHPDPAGTTLAAVRRFVNEQKGSRSAFNVRDRCVLL